MRFRCQPHGPTSCSLPSCIWSKRQTPPIGEGGDAFAYADSLSIGPWLIFLISNPLPTPCLPCAGRAIWKWHFTKAITTLHSKNTSTARQFIMRKANWQLFTARTITALPPYDRSCDEMVKYLYNVLLYVADLSITFIREIPRKIRTSWLIGICKIAEQQRQRAFDRYRPTKTRTDEINCECE